MKITRKELRRLINESYKSWGIFGDRLKDDYRQPIDPEKAKTSFKPALTVVPYQKDSLVFILWRPRHESLIHSQSKEPEVMAMIHAKKTEEACIPVTYEVSQSAVSIDIRGKKGYGALIYGLVFQYMKEKGFGLTSDHTVSSSKSAQSLWDRYADTKTFVKRSTPLGNDTFDYYGKTPDQGDDCGKGVDINKMATHHSWMTSSDKYLNVYNELFNQSSDYFRKLYPESRAILKRNLVTLSFELFHRSLGGN
jgi:hypothetical protein